MIKIRCRDTRADVAEAMVKAISDSALADNFEACPICRGDIEIENREGFPAKYCSPMIRVSCRRCYQGFVAETIQDALEKLKAWHLHKDTLFAPHVGWIIELVNN